MSNQTYEFPLNNPVSTTSLSMPEVEFTTTTEEAVENNENGEDKASTPTSTTTSWPELHLSTTEEENINTTAALSTPCPLDFIIKPVPVPKFVPMPLPVPVPVPVPAPAPAPEPAPVPMPAPAVDDAVPLQSPEFAFPPGPKEQPTANTGASVTFAPGIGNATAVSTSLPPGVASKSPTAPATGFVEYEHKRCTGSKLAPSDIEMEVGQSEGHIRKCKDICRGLENCTGFNEIEGSCTFLTGKLGLMNAEVQGSCYVMVRNDDDFVRRSGRRCELPLSKERSQSALTRTVGSVQECMVLCRGLSNCTGLDWQGDARSCVLYHAWPLGSDSAALETQTDPRHDCYLKRMVAPQRPVSWARMERALIAADAVTESAQPPAAGRAP